MYKSMSPSIAEYKITEPPTSEEVSQRALRALLSGNTFMDIVIEPTFDVPKEPQQDLTLDIKKTTHMDGNSVVYGEIDPNKFPNMHTITIYLNPDESQPATATILRG